MIARYSVKVLLLFYRTCRRRVTSPLKKQKINDTKMP